MLAQQGKCNVQMSELLKQGGLSRKNNAKPNGQSGEVTARTYGFSSLSLCMAVGESVGQMESSVFLARVVAHANYTVDRRFAGMVAHLWV